MRLHPLQGFLTLSSHHNQPECKQDWLRQVLWIVQVYLVLMIIRTVKGKIIWALFCKVEQIVQLLPVWCLFTRRIGFRILLHRRGVMFD